MTRLLEQDQAGFAAGVTNGSALPPAAAPVTTLAYNAAHFVKGAAVLYRDRSGAWVQAKIVAVDLSIQPPSYGIELPNGSFRETEAHRLQPAGVAPPSAAPPAGPTGAPGQLLHASALALLHSINGSGVQAATTALPAVATALPVATTTLPPTLTPGGGADDDFGDFEAAATVMAAAAAPASAAALGPAVGLAAAAAEAVPLPPPASVAAAPPAAPEAEADDFGDFEAAAPAPAPSPAPIPARAPGSAQPPKTVQVPLPMSPLQPPPPLDRSGSGSATTSPVVQRFRNFLQVAAAEVADRLEAEDRAQQGQQHLQQQTQQAQQQWGNPGMQSPPARGAAVQAPPSAGGLGTAAVVTAPSGLPPTLGGAQEDQHDFGDFEGAAAGVQPLAMTAQAAAAQASVQVAAAAPAVPPSPPAGVQRNAPLPEDLFSEEPAVPAAPDEPLGVEAATAVADPAAALAAVAAAEGAAPAGPAAVAVGAAGAAAPQLHAVLAVPASGWEAEGERIQPQQQQLPPPQQQQQGAEEEEDDFADFVEAEEVAAAAAGSGGSTQAGGAESVSHTAGGPARSSIESEVLAGPMAASAAAVVPAPFAAAAAAEEAPWEVPEAGWQQAGEGTQESAAPAPPGLASKAGSSLGLEDTAQVLHGTALVDAPGSAAAALASPASDVLGSGSSSWNDAALAAAAPGSPAATLPQQPAPPSGSAGCGTGQSALLTALHPVSPRSGLDGGSRSGGGARDGSGGTAHGMPALSGWSVAGGGGGAAPAAAQVVGPAAEVVTEYAVAWARLLQAAAHQLQVTAALWAEAGTRGCWQQLQLLPAVQEHLAACGQLYCAAAVVRLAAQQLGLLSLVPELQDAWAEAQAAWQSLPPAGPPPPLPPLQGRQQQVGVEEVQSPDGDGGVAAAEAMGGDEGESGMLPPPQPPSFQAAVLAASQSLAPVWAPAAPAPPAAAAAAAVAASWEELAAADGSGGSGGAVHDPPALVLLRVVEGAGEALAAMSPDDFPRLLAWSDGLCGVTLLPLSLFEEHVAVAPWLEGRPCLVPLANLWLHRVSVLPPQLD